MKKPIAAMLAAVAVTATVGLVTGAILLWQWWRPWMEWRSFAQTFVQADGRVIDRTAADRTTSEAQAYALFFALVANDRPRFDRILQWTIDNLCQGDLRAHLPAWKWGQNADGSWGVNDANPAADADLWLAYTLIEAGRLWQRPELHQQGMALLALVKAQEVVELPLVGAMLLPAPKGFLLENGNARLNPSYLPEFQFRALALADSTGPWQQVWNNHQRLMPAVLAAGIAPDWYQLTPAGAVVPDDLTKAIGSYDAIRVYLWSGMTTQTDKQRDQLLELLAPFARLLSSREAPPERIDSRTLQTSGGAPIGFSGAVLPFLARLDEDRVVKQRQRLENSRVNGNLGNPPHYYDQVLALFGEGWSADRFRFEQNGQVIPRWVKKCCEWPL